MSFDKNSLYSRLPIWAQNAAISLEGFRIQLRRKQSQGGKQFEACAKRKQVSRSELDAFRASRLSLHLRDATGSPFWRSRFAQFGLRPEASDPFAELAKLPVLTKEEVRAAAHDIINAELSPRKLRPLNTGGTTGAGLRMWETGASENERWAVWWRYRAVHGIHPGTWCHYFGGRSVVPVRQEGPPYWRINYPGKSILYSAYHLRNETAKDYLRKIQSSTAPWVHGYPSVLALIAGHASDLGMPIGGAVRIVTTGAENLLEHQRKLIARNFGAPVVQHYGQAESVANFSECAHGRLHVDEDFSFTEFIPVAGLPGRHRVIGTNWTNPAFPLFRYDTGDVADTTAHGECACGSFWRTVNSVDGREEDYVVNGKGNVIGRLDHIFKDAVTVKEAQVRQDKPGEVTIIIVPGHGYARPADEGALMKSAVERLGSETQIRIEYAESLPRTASGKLRMVVSALKPIGGRQGDGSGY